MLSYDDLTLAQKRWVDLIEEYFPDIKTRGFITHKEIHAIHDVFEGRRNESAKFKVAKPLWMITENAFERGKYRFPAQGIVLEDAAAIDTELESVYREELLKCGIAPRDRRNS